MPGFSDNMIRETYAAPFMCLQGGKMKRRILTAACVLLFVLAAVPGIAAAALPPSDFTDAMQGPRADQVQAGGYICVDFTSPDKGGMDGSIVASDNLELQGFTSTGVSFQLSADNHVVCVFGDTVTYTYKVNAAPGDQVSVALQGAESADGLGGLFAMTDEVWEAQVSEEAAEEPAPLTIIMAAEDCLSGPQDQTAPAGAMVDISFTSPKGGGMEGEILVSDNLEYAGMRSRDIGTQLSAENHVVTLFGDTVTYTYRVNAGIGEKVSVQLKDPMISDADRNLYAVPSQAWEGTVREAAAEDFAVQPAEDVPEKPTVKGTFLEAPQTAASGSCIEITVTSPEDGGLNGALHTSANLVYEGSRGSRFGTELSSEKRVTSLFGDPITYIYRVEAEPGEKIWVTLQNAQASDGEFRIAKLEDEAWSCTVRPSSASADDAAAFTAVMQPPEPGDLVSGGSIDVSFVSPPDGGMEGMVTTSSNLVFEGTVSAGNSASLSSDGCVRSVLGDSVTYRYRVTGEPGEGVYVRLTDGKTADAGSRLSSRVRDQIWMGEIQAVPADPITPSAHSGLTVTPTDNGARITGLALSSAGHLTVGGLKSRLLTLDGLSLDVVTADGKPADDNAPAATGQVVRALDADGRQAAAATVLVGGDVTGTGRLSIGQLVRLAAGCTGARPLAGVYMEAGDLNANGKLDIGDLAQMAERMNS